MLPIKFGIIDNTIFLSYLNSIFECVAGIKLCISLCFKTPINLLSNTENHLSDKRKFKQIEKSHSLVLFKKVFTKMEFIHYYWSAHLLFNKCADQAVQEHMPGPCMQTCMD